MADETRTIRIGSENRQTSTFIAGINSASADAAVCINTDDQLGLCSESSRRFKEAVEAMADTSTMVTALRPVTFRFKPEAGQSTERPLRYGLIAEEVAEVLPTLVTYDEDGRPTTVRYDLLTPLLLNELQRQEKALKALHKEIANLKRKRRFRSP